MSRDSLTVWLSVYIQTGRMSVDILTDRMSTDRLTVYKMELRGNFMVDDNILWTVRMFADIQPGKMSIDTLTGCRHPDCLQNGAQR